MPGLRAIPIEEGCCIHSVFVNQYFSFSGSIIRTSVVVSYLSLEGHQLNIQLTQKGAGSRGTAGHGHNILLGQVHAFGGTTAGALVMTVLQGLVLPSTQSHLRSWHWGLCLALKADNDFKHLFMRYWMVQDENIVKVYETN